VAWVCDVTIDTVITSKGVNSTSSHVVQVRKATRGGKAEMAVYEAWTRLLLNQSPLQNRTRLDLRDE
jgi:hypothetical protein